MTRTRIIEGEIVGVGDGATRSYQLRKTPAIPESVRITAGLSYTWEEIQDTWKESQLRWSSLKTIIDIGSYTVRADGALEFDSDVTDGIAIVADYAVEMPDRPYQVRLLTHDRILLAVLNDHIDWRYTRRSNEATEISVTVPRRSLAESLPGDIHAFLNPIQPATLGTTIGETPSPYPTEQAGIAGLVEIWRGDQLLASGRISSRAIDTNTVTLRCHTEEILLEQTLTPAQYGGVLNGLDLADVARSLLDGWHVHRVKAQSQWEDAVDSNQVDTSTEPGIVMLAKDSSGRYHASGYIVLRFLRNDVPGFKRWDRIRWLSDNAAPVRTTMQYRYGDDEETLGSWSTEIDGALPDMVGVVPVTDDANILEVRINLYTDDRDAPDPAGDPVGQTPYVFALEVIARTKGTIAADGVPESTGVIVSGIEADNATAFAVLRDACEQAGWEFRVLGGTLYLAESFGADRISEFVLRNGTNMDVDALGEDEEEMVNVLTAYGPGDGINRMQVTLVDSQSIAAFGQYPKAREFPRATTFTQLREMAQAHIASHNTPRQSFAVVVRYPYGEEPDVGLGDIVRTADPDTGVVTVGRVDEESRSYTTSGLTLRLRINKPRPTLRPGEVILPPPPPTPIILLSDGAPGLVATVRGRSPRSARYEIHASTQQGFTPNESTVVAVGDETRYEITRLAPGRRWYVRARAIDQFGRPSGYSSEVSAISRNAAGLVLVAASDTPTYLAAGAQFVCDGTDDQLEIQEAIDLVANGGGTILLLEGTYHIAGTINLKSFVTLRGQGNGTRLRLVDDFVTPSFNIVRGWEIEDAEVSNLAIDGNKRSDTLDVHQHGVYLAWSKYCRLESLRVRNLSSRGLELFRTEASVVRGNMVTGCNQYGIFISESPGNTVTGNVTRQNNIGIGVAAPASSGNTITGNTCDENASWGIDLGAPHSVVVGNACRLNGTGSSSRGGIRIQGRSNLVSGNTASQNRGHGIVLTGIGAKDNSVTENLCESNSQHANNATDNIHVANGAQNNNIQGNTCRRGELTNGPRYGIAVMGTAGSGNVVTNNDLLDGGVTAAFLDNATGTVTSAGNRT